MAQQRTKRRFWQSSSPPPPSAALLITWTPPHAIGKAESNDMQKHFFFDLDNTLTRSKSHIEPAHADILRTLMKRADVVVVSGHGEKDIHAHLEDLSGYYVLSQNGNHAEKPDSSTLWERKLSATQVKSVHEFIEKARVHLALPVRDENDIVEDRGCEVAYSLIGHHENIETKEAFDPDHAKRKKLLEDMREDVARLKKEAAIEIKIGGTTVLDFFEKGKNKGFNITEFIKALDWKKENCTYIGDALFPGGNDETVIGIIPTKSIKDYHETYEYLASILK
jgi:HAD superfamily hydrolase (TIGR01484 family)